MAMVEARLRTILFLPVRQSRCYPSFYTLLCIVLPLYRTGSSELQSMPWMDVPSKPMMEMEST